jgi:methylaspartate mutase epsilon subunit
MSAEQGVKYFDPQVSNCMNIVQDVAANRALLRLLREYLDKYGYHGVTLLNRGYPFQGAWPRDVFQMAAVASLCVTTAVLQGVDVIRLRSLDESVATPTKEGNLLAIRIANQVIGSLKGQRMPESKELTLEQEMIEKEVRATVDKVIEVGDGDVARGMVKAVEHGILDCNFSPWIHYKGKVLLVRDKEGALRYLDRGNIPLPKEVVEYHREKIRERELAEHKKAGLEMVIRDVYQISNVSMKTP